jgi:hypothetical protein
MTRPGAFASRGIKIDRAAIDDKMLLAAHQRGSSFFCSQGKTWRRRRNTSPLTTRFNPAAIKVIQ